jgi:hypothetical protein
MYCPKCGSKNEDGAKFCSACGNALITVETIASSIANAPSQPKPLAEKVFFEQGGVLVSDAVFRTTTGSSYPIRNISSVTVAQKPSNWLVVLIAGALTIFGLAVAGTGGGGVSLVFIIPGIFFWIILFNRPYQLKIGAGGVLQMAIEDSNEGRLNQVARSINDAIIYIQRGNQN